MSKKKKLSLAQKINRARYAKSAVGSGDGTILKMADKGIGPIAVTNGYRNITKLHEIEISAEIKLGEFLQKMDKNTGAMGIGKSALTIAQGTIAKLSDYISC